MIITVTQEDIDAGLKCDCEQCPIAQAFNRSIPGSACAIENLKVAELTDNWRHVIYIDLPKIASKFIYDFDIGRPVQPFSFEIDMPLDKRPGTE